MNKAEQRLHEEIARLQQLDPANLIESIGVSIESNEPFDLGENEPQNITKFDAEVLSIIALRNNLLAQTDWMVMPDNALTEEELKSLQEYRAALRNAPNQEGFKDPGHENYAKLPVVPKFKYSETLERITGDHEDQYTQEVTPENSEFANYIDQSMEIDEFHPDGIVTWERVERSPDEKPPPIGSENVE